MDSRSVIIHSRSVNHDAKNRNAEAFGRDFSVDNAKNDTNQPILTVLG